ncbi:MAG: GTP-binding protein [Gracilibacteraceae bacterium]|jgi:G3E family GTPase|nr:GTP-binding protein [Gracilibacteraceae bacterium]
MGQDIDLYLISGFLGSGKTTFLQNLLEQPLGCRVGVIINEFGQLGVDGTILRKGDFEMIEINNGSIFCSCIKSGFIEGLLAMLSQPIDLMLIEASGMADPFGMKGFLENLDGALDHHPEITRRYAWRGSVCLIDALYFEDYFYSFVAIKKQVEKSSLLVVNKTDLVDKERLEELHAELRVINNDARIYDTTYGKMPWELLRQVLDPARGAVGDTINTCDVRPAYYSIDMGEKIETEKFAAFLQVMAGDAVRVKGFFRDENGKEMFADVVGSSIGLRPVTAEEAGRVVFELDLIGSDADSFETAVEQAWRSVFPQRKIARRDL